MPSPADTFGQHRDDTGNLVAHRRFAVSVPLNDEFDGGGITFPEFGPRSFQAAAGSAIVFSCSLLHKVDPVTRGTRYVFLTFLFDEEAERLRADRFPGGRRDRRAAGHGVRQTARLRELRLRRRTFFFPLERTLMDRRLAFGRGRGYRP